MNTMKRIEAIIPLIHMGRGYFAGRRNECSSSSYRPARPEGFNIFSAWLPSYTVFSIPLLLAEDEQVAGRYPDLFGAAADAGQPSLYERASRLLSRAAESVPESLRRPLDVFGLSADACDAACAGLSGLHMAMDVPFANILKYTGPEITSVAYCADPAVCAGVLARCASGFFRAGYTGDYSFPMLWRACIVDGLTGIETRPLALKPEPQQEEKKNEQP